MWEQSLSSRLLGVCQFEVCTVGQRRERRGPPALYEINLYSTKQQSSKDNNSLTVAHYWQQNWIRHRYHSDSCRMQLNYTGSTQTLTESAFLLSLLHACRLQSERQCADFGSDGAFEMDQKLELFCVSASSSSIPLQQRKTEPALSKNLRPYRQRVCSLKGKIHQFSSGYQVAVDANWSIKFLFVLYWQRKLSFLSCPLHTAFLAVPTCTRMHCANTHCKQRGSGLSQPETVTRL